MKIAVVGLWHLGCVTAACLAQGGHDVIGLDLDAERIQSLKENKAPLFEPDLDALIKQGIQAGNLMFTRDPTDLSLADIIWITFDTPVDEKDIADTEWVFEQLKKILPHAPSHALILISSQLPVGSSRKLQHHCQSHLPDKQFSFAYSPENLRLGKAIQVFTHPDRVIMGLEKETDRLRIQKLFAPFTTNIIWMSLESAEMTKHALNAFLATSVVFINELATLCEHFGADAREVEKGLKSEDRIGEKAYLRPGNAIAGGTLARDVNFLIQIGDEKNQPTPLFDALLVSNQAHKQWTCRRIQQVLQTIQSRTITTLGLTYKAGTNTLRRSAAVETCEWLSQQGAKIVAYDPSLSSLPAELETFIELKSSLAEAIKGADAVIVSTEWPEFMALKAEDLLEHTAAPFIFDPSGFLAKQLNDARLNYFSVGTKA